MPHFVICMRGGRDKALFFTPKVLAAFEKLGTVNMVPDPPDDDNRAEFLREWLLQNIGSADAVVGCWGLPRIDQEMLDAASNLKAVLYAGGSVAGIISPELYARGVRVISANRMYAESVAEGALAYMLAGLRQLTHYDNMMHDGQWPTIDQMWNDGLLDACVGLVGLGQVARDLVPLLRPLRCQIAAYDPFQPDETFASLGIQRMDLPELAKFSQVFSLHAAQTPESHHIVNAAILANLPDGALVVNTARAGVMDTAALVAELKKGRLRAVLDVFDEEPLPATDPLKTLSNVMLIPHMAGPTLDRREPIGMMLTEEWKKIANGEPSIHEIGREYGEKMTR